MLTFEKNLYWTEQHNLDLAQLESSCRSVVNYAETNLKGSAEVVDIPLIGDTYNSYNLLLYPLPELSKLYHSIRHTFAQIESGENWWIKCWANIYRDKSHYDWHQHNTSYVDNPNEKYTSYHGIYCVAGEDTVTSYRNIHSQSAVHIPQTPNQLTIIANHPDWYHRTWPYKGVRERVTIAFNILHSDCIDAFKYANHWLPL